VAFGTDVVVYAHGDDAKRFCKGSAKILERGMKPINAIRVATLSEDLLGRSGKAGSLKS
jgi:imidazolonepropionase-like amidohydrolase